MKLPLLSSGGVRPAERDYDDDDDHSSSPLRQRRHDDILSSNNRTTISTQPLLFSEITNTVEANDSNFQQNQQGQLRQRRRNRLLDRDAAFSQSRGRWRVQPTSRGAARLHPDHRRHIFREWWANWFYNAAYQRTAVLMLILFLAYAGLVVTFACIYWSVSRLGQPSSTAPNDSSNVPIPHVRLFCSMDIHEPIEALYFSLSTMASIGYGVSDYYFGGCWMPFVLVITQVCCAITFDAVAIGLLFQRISRGHKRGKTVLFSSTAVIQRVRGVPHMLFRIAELRRHPLLEATVRAYCIRHERHAVVRRGNANDGATTAISIETTHYATKPMKLQHEDVSSHILMSLPQIIVHTMDDKSPLSPSDVWYDVDGQRHENVTVRNSRPNASAVLSSSSVKDHGSAPGDADFYPQNTACLKRFLQDCETEIIVLVEGTDELTGTTTQTRHSYTSNDLAWDCRFVPCIFPHHDIDNVDPAPGDNAQGGDGTNHSWPRRCGRALLRRCQRSTSSRNSSSVSPVCVIDFSRFHETEAAPVDCESCPYVS